MLQGKTTLYDASSWTHFSDDYPCEAVAFSWHACSPRDKLSKLSAAHGYPSATTNCKKIFKQSKLLFMCSRRITPMSGRAFFSSYPNVKTPQCRHVIMSSCHHVIMPLRISGHKERSSEATFSSYRNVKNAAMSSCHHVIMSSCHHAVKDFGTQGERVMRLGVRHGLATLRDNMGTGESNKKSGWNNHPRVRSIRRFFDSNQVPRDQESPTERSHHDGLQGGSICLLTRAPGARSWASTSCRRASRQRRRTTCRCGGAHR